MDRGSRIRPVRAIVVCAGLAFTLLPPVAQGAVPTQGLGELQRTVGEAVSQTADLVKPALPQAAPAPAPAPAPKPAAPAPAPRAATPAPAAAPQAPRAAVKQAGAARASSRQNGGSPGSKAAQEPASPAPARSSGSQPDEPTDAPAATPGPVVVTAADVGTADDEASLPFTGSNMLPLLLVAVLVLLTGAGLRRAVRMR